MNSIRIKLIWDWILQSKIAAISACIFTFLGCPLLFLFGFSMGIPVSLRPFLDDKFFANLSLDFLLVVAVSGLAARVIVLFFRFSLADYQTNFINSYLIDKLKLKHKKLVRINIRLVARYVRRAQFFLTVFLGLLFFAWFFLGYYWWVFIFETLTVLLVFWHLLGKVELRRDVATFKNTSQMSKNRVIFTLLSYLVISSGTLSFLAGMAKFTSRLDTEVSVGIEGKVRRSSLIAVTNVGVIVGSTKEYGYLNRIQSVSAYFIPFDRIESIGQKNNL